MEDMLKTLAELDNMLTEGVEKAVLAAPILALDAQMDGLLTALGYDPSKNKKVALFRETDKTRLAMAKQDAADMEEYPIIAIPYAVAAMVDTIQERVRNELLAFATDFVFTGSRLRFRISFASFGPNMLQTSDNHVSGLGEGKKQMEKLKTRYVVEKKAKGEGYLLPGNQRNILLLKKYCQKFGCNEPSFYIVRGMIRNVEASCACENFVLPAERPKPKPESKSPVITPDELAKLKKTLTNIKFALGSYKSMAEIGSGNILLSVLEGYVYELEQTTGAHGHIWTRKEAEHAGPRAINREIRDVQWQMYGGAVDIVRKQGRKLYAAAYDKLQELTKPLGLFPLEFKFLPYGGIQIELVRSEFILPQDDIILEWDTESKDPDYFQPSDSQKNIELILEQMHMALPSCELQKFDVGYDGEVRTLRTLCLLVRNPGDLKRLMAI